MLVYILRGSQLPTVRPIHHVILSRALSLLATELVPSLTFPLSVYLDSLFAPLALVKIHHASFRSISCFDDDRVTGLFIIMLIM